MKGKAMHVRRGFIIGLFAIIISTIALPKWESDRVWQSTVFAQSALQTIPIAATGGAPGCTVLIPGVAGKQVWVNNGILAIPAIGTGITVQFQSGTDGGAGTACATSGTTHTNLTGIFAGAQVGTSATNETIIPFNGSPAMITPVGTGILMQVAVGTTGTTSQALGGHLTFTQQ